MLIFIFDRKSLYWIERRYLFVVTIIWSNMIFIVPLTSAFSMFFSQFEEPTSKLHIVLAEDEQGISVNHLPSLPWNGIKYKHLQWELLKWLRTSKTENTDKHRRFLVLDFFFFEVLNKIFKSYSGVHKNLASLIKILLVSM